MDFTLLPSQKSPSVYIEGRIYFQVDSTEDLYSLRGTIHQGFLILIVTLWFIITVFTLFTTYLFRLVIDLHLILQSMTDNSRTIYGLQHIY